MPVLSSLPPPNPCPPLLLSSYVFHLSSAFSPPSIYTLPSVTSLLSLLITSFLISFHLSHQSSPFNLVPSLSSPFSLLSLLSSLTSLPTLSFYLFPPYYLSMHRGTSSGILCPCWCMRLLAPPYRAASWGEWECGPGISSQLCSSFSL